MIARKDKSSPTRLNASVWAYEESLLLVRLNGAEDDDAVGLSKEDEVMLQRGVVLNAAI